MIFTDGPAIGGHIVNDALDRCHYPVPSPFKSQFTFSALTWFPTNNILQLGHQHHNQKCSNLLCTSMSDLFSWKKFLRYWICGLVFIAAFAIALTIFVLSLRLYLPWYHATTHSRSDNELLLHVIFLLGGFAPLANILGAIVGGLYYLHKRLTHGPYDVWMRRQGRGYWINPTDAEEKSKEKLAAELNKHLKGKAGPTPQVHVSVLPVKRVHHKHHRMSMLNPFHWGAHHEHSPHDIEAQRDHLATPTRANILSFLAPNPYRFIRARPQTSRMESVHEMDDLSAQLPKHHLSAQQPKSRFTRNAASIKTSENDEMTHTGVSKIWTKNPPPLQLRDRIKERAKMNAKVGDGSAGKVEGEGANGDKNADGSAKKWWFQ